MTKKEVTRYAKAILAHNAPVRPDPKCGRCRGTGVYEWTGGRNNDTDTYPCDCADRQRPFLYMGRTDGELVALAKAFLKGTR